MEGIVRVRVGVVELVNEGEVVEAELVEPVVYNPDVMLMEHGGQNVEMVGAEVGVWLSPLTESVCELLGRCDGLGSMIVGGGGALCIQSF